MTDRSNFQAEDFLIDNSFQLYCSGKDPACVTYWEKWIAAHPEKAGAVAEARRLYTILSGNKQPLEVSLQRFRNSVSRSEQVRRTPFSLARWVAAAAILLIAGFLAIFLSRKPGPGADETAYRSVFATKKGEKKRITLQDGSLVVLNAESRIELLPGFNNDQRKLRLVGEAYFEVAHDSKKPFRVQTADFDIRVLGTVFNVKAYPDERFSEATLIRGSISMQPIHIKSGSITLKPSQKVTIFREERKKRGGLQAAKTSEITINHYTRVKDSSIVETAWVRNRLEIYDQRFEDISRTLERWYDVKIKFRDPDLKDYHFTATIGNEDLRQVLDALKKVEKFDYEIKGEKVFISK
ncbi:anti-sigma factor [Pedobacter yulinensis]|uniref:Anti-sigma factor n=1 Tax=Pedobacter yulinensis TaxID=2126353 RepID=A0A2T3HPQ0_9SPHI|nr:FecR domain-containing protein [Pedobacter yulinensis]PST84406.1 anti-sigma factor [Pedobacter yulinensis]